MSISDSIRLKRTAQDNLFHERLQPMTPPFEAVCKRVNCFFVGNIESTDRLIWGAIGNTTNLAGRLQGLTRDLDASIAIENVSYQGAGAPAADFRRHPDVSIRGRSEPFVVWSLPRRD